MSDLRIYAQGSMLEVENDTRDNLNEIIVGATGAGKTFSNVYPTLAHTYDSSVVVPLTKRELVENFSRVFAERGYKVFTLDFVNPELSDIGYDPMDYVKTEEDALALAESIMSTGEDLESHTDPFWTNSAKSSIAALIDYEMEISRHNNSRPKFSRVVRMFERLQLIDTNGDLCLTNLDKTIIGLNAIVPDNTANKLWACMTNLPAKTAASILVTMKSTFSRVLTKNVKHLISNNSRIDFSDLGREKVALFIVTSPMNKALQPFINIMYADMFKSLFESAEKSERHTLEVPVHIICDDFACGSRIESFEDYISVFRAAGISVTMLLQSESQLESMYGASGAATIINNCSTYIYMGGMDITTCRSISEKCNRSIPSVMALPREHVILMRCGEKAEERLRYQTLDDPVFKEYFGPSINKSERN